MVVTQYSIYLSCKCMKTVLLKGFNMVMSEFRLFWPHFITADVLIHVTE